MWRFGVSAGRALLGGLALFSAIPAAAQVSISANPLQLNFAVPAGALSQAKNVEITTSVPTTVIVQVLTGAEWLVVQTGPVNVTGTPVPTLSLPVRVNAQSLNAGSYQGSFRVFTQTQQVVITVSALVGGETLLTVSPSSLNFTALEGGTTGNPASAHVNVGSLGGALSYTLSVQTDAGGNWLLINPTSGTTGGAGFDVSVNPAALAPGTYTGKVIVESVSTADATQVAVTLVVGAGSTLSVAPAVLPTFLYQIGGAAPAPQNLVVSTTAGVISFTVAESPDVSWLTVSPAGGTASGEAPVTITLAVNTAALVVGAYTTNLVITPTNGTPLPPIPVRLAVSTAPLLQVSRTSLSFRSPFGGPIPAGQTFGITAAGSGPSPGFIITSGAGWLNASPDAGATPATVTVTVNPAGLPVGTHTSSLIVRPGNGDQYFHQVFVSFSIADLPDLEAGPATLLFSHQTGASPPQAQQVALRSTGAPINFVAFTSTSNCGPAWLSAVPSQTITPATLTVFVTTAGMTPGVCSGAIELRFDAGQGLESLQIPVTVAVSSSPMLRVTLAPGFGLVSVVRGQTAPTQDLSFTSTSPNTQVNFTMSQASSGWLVVPGGTQTTPANLGVLILPGGLDPGTYNGEITISSPSLPLSFVVPVTLKVLPEITVEVAPLALTFSQPQGGSPSPPQTLTMIPVGGDGATFNATITQVTGGNWLQIDRTSGAATGDILVSVRPNQLPVGTYTARITISFINSISPPVQIPVTLNVVSAQRVDASVSQLTFNHTLGGSPPAPQTFTITGSPGPSNFTVGTTSSGWLTVNAASGTTPAQITASVTVTGLAPGTYNGSITITAPGAAGSPITIPVTLNISGPPAPVIQSVTNNASNQPGPVTGGELLTLKGTFLPAGIPDALFTVNPGGTISSLLQGVRVLFDGAPGTPIYVSRTQINVIAPYEILGRASVAIVVEYLGVASAAFQTAVAVGAPGIYTLDSTGQGQAAALNANGTFNGPGGNNTSPSPAGSTIVVYLTGGGQTTPPSTSGTVTPTTRLFPLLGSVSAEIGGLPALVEFIGAAPGLVTGVVQANLRPNPNVHGNAAVRVTINGSPSPPGPTVAIQ
jgi:uncharacterized protein (TIGR03437 family)